MEGLTDEEFKKYLARASRDMDKVEADVSNSLYADGDTAVSYTHLDAINQRYAAVSY